MFFVYQAECTQCGETMEPIFQWVSGQWVPAVMQQLLWTNSSVSSVRRRAPFIDFLKLQRLVSDAISTKIQSAYVQDVSCLFGNTFPSPSFCLVFVIHFIDNLRGALNAMTCDCMSGPASDICFDGSVTFGNVTDRACPYLASTIEVVLLLFTFDILDSFHSREVGSRCMFQGGRFPQCRYASEWSSVPSLRRPSKSPTESRSALRCISFISLFSIFV